MASRSSLREFADIARAASLLAVFTMILRVCPARLLRAGQRVRTARRGTRSPEQVVHAVRTASLVAGGTCLARALVARTLLARAGVPVTVVLGAARVGEGLLSAHAWIEHAGRPIVSGEPAPAFAAVWRLTPAGVR